MYGVVRQSRMRIKLSLSKTTARLMSPAPLFRSSARSVSSSVRSVGNEKSGASERDRDAVKRHRDKYNKAATPYKPSAHIAVTFITIPTVSKTFAPTVFIASRMPSPFSPLARRRRTYATNAKTKQMMLRRRTGSVE